MWTPSAEVSKQLLDAVLEIAESRVEVDQTLLGTYNLLVSDGSKHLERKVEEAPFRYAGA